MADQASGICLRHAGQIAGENGKVVYARLQHGRHLKRFRPFPCFGIAGA